MKIILEFDSIAEAAPALEALGSATAAAPRKAKVKDPVEVAANIDAVAAAPSKPSVPAPVTAPTPAPVANEAELRDKVGELTIKVRDTKGRAVAVEVLMRHLPPGTEKPRARDIKAENLAAAIADLEAALA